jgi:hypothetical protein
MDERQLRTLVREAVARHLDAAEGPAGVVREASARHASHGQYLHLVNESDACLIEPTVLCNHCGYCKSHGH